MVVDASVAVKWFVVEEGTAEAQALLASGESLAAPEIVLAETVNALWRYARRGLYEKADVVAVGARLVGYFTALAALQPVIERAAAIAVELEHPVYDCIYLALAERLDEPLVTADDRLLKRLAGTQFAQMAEPLVR